MEAWKDSRNRVGGEDPDNQANDKQRQLDPGLADGFLYREANQNDDVEDENRAQQGNVVDVVGEPVSRIVRHADHRSGVEGPTR